MIALGRHIPQRGIYSLALRGGRLVFGPENYPEGDPMSSPPGTVYEEPAPEAFESFAQGKAIVGGPYVDEYGTFVSAFVPVRDPCDGEILMLAAIDTLAGDWNATLRAAGRESILGSLILLVTLLAGAGVASRCKRSNTPDVIGPGNPYRAARVDAKRFPVPAATSGPACRWGWACWPWRS